MKKIRKGFTLIELIASMAIMAIIGVGIASVFSSTIKLKEQQTDKLTLQQNAIAIQRNMYNDIRKAKKIIDGSYDTSKKRWVLIGSNMDQNNDYCRLKGYKPLLYTESIVDNRLFYVYDKAFGEVRKVAIPNDSTTTTVTKYFTNSLEYDNTTEGTEWLVVSEADKIKYTPPNINYSITDEVVIKGLVIKYDSTNDGIDNPVNFNKFVEKGAFSIKEGKVEKGKYVVLESKIINVDGKYPWFVLPIKAESLVLYTKVKDSLVGKYLVKHDSLDGIEVTKNSTTTEGDSLKGYYNVQLYTKKSNAVKEFEFRVSTVDYGGDIK